MPRLKSVISAYLRLTFNPKSIILLNAIFFALAAMPLTGAYAANVTLGWDSNPEPDLEGYVVHRNVGSPGPPYDYSNDLPEDELANPLHPKVTLTGLSEDTPYYIALTAYNTEGVESSYSDDVCVEIVDGAVEPCNSSSSIGGAADSGGSGGGSGAGCFISTAKDNPQNNNSLFCNLIILAIAAIGIYFRKNFSNRPASE